VKTKEERIDRILARGEVSGHCHVIIGNDVDITRNIRGELIIEVRNGEAILRHILEHPWVEKGEQIWTQEHKDISIKKGVYEFVQQTEFDPFLKSFQNIND